LHGVDVVLPAEDLHVSASRVIELAVLKVAPALMDDELGRNPHGSDAPCQSYPPHKLSTELSTDWTFGGLLPAFFNPQLTSFPIVCLYYCHLAGENPVVQFKR
jgi:hypothetical protein